MNVEIQTHASLQQFVPASLMFTGEQIVQGCNASETWSTRHSDADWADALLARLAPDEKAILSLSYTRGGPAIAHRVSPADISAPVFATDSNAQHDVQRHPSEADYAERVSYALQRIERGEFDKVVLGRCLDVVSTPPLQPAHVLARLLESRPGRYIFSVPLGMDTHSATLVGASPELLVRRLGERVSSFPLAGSIPRSPDPDEDLRRARQLQSSDKDLAEHAIVVRAIVDALSSICVDIEAPSKPELVSTDTLWHLGTPISARLRPGAARSSALHLAQLLHPTPAVGGSNAAALDMVDELEGSMRGYLAGCVGWVDGAGDGEFAVTIRAGVIQGERMRLFAGAGIVTGSQPDAEVKETGAKLATMARVLGL